MGIHSSAHLAFGLPINEEDHPEFWSVVDPEYPEEQPELDQWFVQHSANKPQRELSFLSYGAHDSYERKEAILMIDGAENCFFGECHKSGPGLHFGLNHELSGPEKQRSPQEPSFKDVVKATDDLRAAGIEGLDFRDAAWYLVVSIG